MNCPDNLKYTKEHLWVRVEDSVATIGITDFAQDQLGDILYVELPEEGENIERGEEVTVVESSKQASSLPSPVTGKVIAINEKLDDDPEDINEGAYDAWIAKIELEDKSELDELLTAIAYKEAC